MDLPTHRIRWELDGEREETTTCDAVRAGNVFRGFQKLFKEGGRVGFVSWSINGFLSDYASSPGYVLSKRAEVAR